MYTLDGKRALRTGAGNFNKVANSVHHAYKTINHTVVRKGMLDREFMWLCPTSYQCMEVS